ncbi:MAG: pseudouridine synthase [Patescibacteria group bacterium]
MEKIRLQKYIASQGICSRRQAEELIGSGQVKVNRQVTTELGTKVDPSLDRVDVFFNKEWKKLKNENEEEKKNSLVYIALNKPIDYICSNSGEQGKTVLDLLTKENNLQKKDLKTRVFPVGRLDKDSEGLVLLTNDGNLTNILTHPRFEHEKEYEVMIDKALDKKAKKVLEIGMFLDAEKTEFVQGIKILREFNKGRRTLLNVILKEGKNRQIRKMFGNLGYHVQSLKRVRIKKLRLNTLPVGKWKFIKKENII